MPPGRGPGTPQIGPKEAGIAPPVPGKALFLGARRRIGPPDRQAEVGDRFDHPQGLQVKALHSDGFYANFKHYWADLREDRKIKSGF